MRKFLLILIMIMIPLTAVAKSGDKKRAKILKTGQETLVQLYKEHPSAQEEIENSIGYAVFSNIGVNVIFLSGGSGKGYVHDNKSGENTYMKMASAGVGIGIGVKDFRAIFVFTKRKAMTQFLDKGWDFSGQADAAAQSGDKGGEGSAAGTVMPGVKVYQITKNGLALQATLQGTKYWKDKKLNKNK